MSKSSKSSRSSGFRFAGNNQLLSCVFIRCVDNGPPPYWEVYSNCSLELCSTVKGKYNLIYAFKYENAPFIIYDIKQAECLTKMLKHSNITVYHIDNCNFVDSIELPNQDQPVTEPRKMEEILLNMHSAQRQATLNQLKSIIKEIPKGELPMTSEISDNVLCETCEYETVTHCIPPLDHEDSTFNISEIDSISEHPAFDFDYASVSRAMEKYITEALSPAPVTQTVVPRTAVKKVNRDHSYVEKYINALRETTKQQTLRGIYDFTRHRFSALGVIIYECHDFELWKDSFDIHNFSISDVLLTHREHNNQMCLVLHAVEDCLLAVGTSVARLDALSQEGKSFAEIADYLESRLLACRK